MATTLQWGDRLLSRLGTEKLIIKGTTEHVKVKNINTGDMYLLRVPITLAVFKIK